MAMTWKAGVIGCGSIAQYMHLPGYAKCPGISLVAACDPVAARRREARAFAEGLRTYADYRRMLASEHLDVVSVSSPNCFHAEHAIAALEAGAHVLLEKPAALNMKEIADIRRAVRRSGRKLIVGFSHRFRKGNLIIQKLLRDGAIGEPFMIRVRFAHAGPYPGWAKSNWFYRPRLAGGGAMLDMGIHAIDLALWHIGPVRSVQATARTLRKKIPVDDNAVLLLEFANRRALGYIEVGWTSPSGFNGLEIIGDEGAIVQDYTPPGTVTLTVGRISPDTQSKARPASRVVERNACAGGWDTEVADSVRAFRRGTDLGAGIDAGGAALAVALAAYESSRTGRRVNVASVR